MATHTTSDLQGPLGRSVGSAGQSAPYNIGSSCAWTAGSIVALVIVLIALLLI